MQVFDRTVRSVTLAPTLFNGRLYTGKEKVGRKKVGCATTPPLPKIFGSSADFFPTFFLLFCLFKQMEAG